MQDSTEKSKLASEVCNTCGLMLPGEDQGDIDICQCSGENSSKLDNPEISKDYSVIETLGAGGMGEVYKVKENSTGHIYALKVVHQKLKEGSDSYKRFEREMRALASLEHKGLVKIFDHGNTDDGRQFLLMEYIGGCDLSDLLYDQGKLPEARAINIFIQAFDALAYVHSKNIVHRDLKPSNILIKVKDGVETVKIVDFGIAKFMNTEALDMTAITRTGDIFGSPAYMSPEQCEGDKVSEASDIYSMGCLMYECLTGRVPFQDDNPVNVVLNHIHDQPKSLNSYDIGMVVSEEMESIVLNCLVKNPKLRYKNAKAAKLDLERLKAGNSIKKRRVDTSSSSVKIAKKLLLYVSTLSLCLATITGVILIQDYNWLVNLSKVSQLGYKYSDEKLKIGKELVKVADSYNKPFAQLILAEIYYEQGKLDQAENLIDNSISTFVERGDDSQNLEPFLRLSMAINLDRKNFEKADEYYQRVLKLSKDKSRNREGVKSIAVFKGFFLPAPIVSTYDVMKDYADACSARGYFKKADSTLNDLVDYSRLYGSHMELFQALRKRAQLLYSMGQTKNAESYRDDALRLLDKKDLKNEFKPLRDLGDDYLIINDYKNAKSMYEKLARLHDTVSQNSSAKVLDDLRLAYSLSLLGKTEQAAKLYSRLYDRVKSNPDTYEGRRVLRANANFNLYCKKYNNTEKILSELLTVYKSHENHMRTATISIRMANCLARKGDKEKSEQFLKEAMDQFKQVDFGSLQKDKLFYESEFLNECSMVMKMLDKPKEAKKLNEKSLQLRNKLSPNTYKYYLSKNRKAHIVDSDYHFMGL